ncbi:unnamed protein product [Bursaphelenchus xylophilus]|uniref:(pine wood nematode) hypothetical protein n=1 Tax=Bursaphelenchus xylophilus TaxID=6326 RepID=A0A7I8X9K1_BURXY|nr:unnamed protein product [Bursaphelenchus xylophilus]CAG9119346.1 unnamed protein product [Bursaphelenchus xylophilus]
MAEYLKDFALFRNDANHSAVSADEFKNKIVGLYFSGHWCPPCRKFTPVLKDFYERSSADLEIVFISRDHTEKQMMNYLKESHGKWLYIKTNTENYKKLNKKYNVLSIPTLILVKPDGTTFESDVVEEIFESKGSSELIKKWKEKMNKT